MRVDIPRPTMAVALAGLLVAGLALIISLGGGAAATPAETAKVGKLTQKTGKTRIVGPGKVAIATARCPKRMKAISGGFESAEGAGAKPTEAPGIRASERGGRRTWVVVAQNPSNSVGLFNAVAYCVR